MFLKLTLVALLVACAVAVSAAGQYPIPKGCKGTYNTIPIIEDAVETAKLVAQTSIGKKYLALPGSPDNYTILHLFGKTAYDNGLAHGQLMKEEISKLIPAFTVYIEQQINASVPNLPPKLLDYLASHGLNALLDLTIAFTKPHTPTYFLEELQGVADGCGISFNEIYRLMMVPELIKAGCTVIGATKQATTGTKQLRALDIGFFPVRDWPMVSVYHFGTNPIQGNVVDTAVFGWPVLNVGMLTGVTRDGVSIGEKVWLNHSKTGIDKLEGTPWMFLLRDAATRHRTVDSAVAGLKQANRTCAIHVGIGDHNDQFQGVEMAGGSFGNWTWRELGAWKGHPLVQDIFYWDKHKQLGGLQEHDTCLPELLQQRQGNVTAEELVQISSIFQTGNLHSATFDLGSNVAYFANAMKQGVTTGSMNAFARQWSKLDLNKMFNEQP